MPKSTNEKNTKGTKKNVATKATTKKVANKKVETKKAAPKKVEVKKVDNKKVAPKKVETKKTAPKTVEVKKVETKKEKKGNEIVNKIMENKPFAISLCVIIVLVAVLILTLCIKSIPKTKDGNDILVSLKGKNITADDLYVNLKDEYGEDALLELIDEYIAEKEVKVTKADKEYVKQVVDYYKEYADYYGVDFATFLTTYVGINGVETEEQFSDYILKDYKKTLAIEKFISDEASEKELKEYYKNNYSDKLTVKHILIEIDTENEDTEAADKEAYNKAAKLIEKLNNTSAKKLDSKFEQLAEDNSDDTATYSNGGLIEDFSKNDMDENFWNAAYALKDGEYTKEPVKSAYGYHIILKVSSTPVEKYKDIKDEVKKAYAESLLAQDSTLFAKKWDELRKQYKMDIKDSNLNKGYKAKLKANTTVEETTEETAE